MLFAVEGIERKILHGFDFDANKNETFLIPFKALLIPFRLPKTVKNCVLRFSSINRQKKVLQTFIGKRIE